MNFFGIPMVAFKNVHWKFRIFLFGLIPIGDLWVFEKMKQETANRLNFFDQLNVLVVFHLDRLFTAVCPFA